MEGEPAKLDTDRDDIFKDVALSCTGLFNVAILSMVLGPH